MKTMKVFEAMDIALGVLAIGTEIARMAQQAQEEGRDMSEAESLKIKEKRQQVSQDFKDKWGQ